MRSSSRFLWTLAVCLSTLGGTVSARDVRLHAHWTVARDFTKDQFKGTALPEDRPKTLTRRMAIRLMAQTPQGRPVSGSVFRPGSALLTRPGFFVLKARTGEKPEDQQTVEYDVRPLLDRTPPHGIEYVLLVPRAAPRKKDVKYTLELAEGASLREILVAGFELQTGAGGFVVDLGQDDLERDLAYLEANKAIEPKIELKSGEESTVTARLLYGFNNWDDGNQWRFQALFEAEGTYRPKTKNRYLNEITGALDYLAAFTWGEDWAVHGLTSIGPSARIETDQYFDRVDGAASVATWTALNGGPLQALARALCFTGNHPGSAPSLIFTLHYDWVFNVSEDAATRVREREDTTHRLRARLYWSTLLAHDVPVPWVGRCDANFLIDAGGTYDLRSSEFVPDVNLSLEIGRTKPVKDGPSLIVTYSNGKTRTKFENYDTLLAGFKFPF